MTDQVGPIAPDSEVPPASLPKNEMRRPRLKRVWIILLPAALLLFLSTAFLAWQNWQLKQQLTNVASSPSPTPRLTPDPTANWKTYASQNLNVSFQYPPFFETSEFIAQPSPLGYLISSQIDLKKFPTTLTTPPRKQIMIMTISDKDASYFLDIKVGIKYSDPNLNQGYTTITYRLPNMTVGNLDSYVYEQYAEDAMVELSKIIIIKKDKIYYEISMPYSNYPADTPSEVPGKDIDYITIFDQILSTFQFVETGKSDFTCPANGWVDCVPIIEGPKVKACSPEALEWYKAHCPNFQGVAY